MQIKQSLSSYKPFDYFIHEKVVIGRRNPYHLSTISSIFINLALLVPYVGILNVFLLNKVKLKNICEEVSDFLTVVLNLLKTPVKRVINNLSYIVFTSRVYLTKEFISQINRRALVAYFMRLETLATHLRERLDIITDILRSNDLMLIRTQEGLIGIMEDGIADYDSDFSVYYREQNLDFQETNREVLEILNNIKRLETQTNFAFSTQSVNFNLEFADIMRIYNNLFFNPNP